LGAIILGLLAPASTPVGVAAHNVHPFLRQIAGQEPDQWVSVIVQKADDSKDAETLVEELGGRITKDLHIIHAFAAELPAKAALLLAKNESVQWVSLDAPMEKAGKPVKDPDPAETQPINYFLDTLNVRDVWEMGFQGQGVTVAVVDSGIIPDRDLATKNKTRILFQVSFSTNATKTSDDYGHGTHVAGVVGGNGEASSGQYAGIAPQVNLINLKISDDYGMAYESDTVLALQWALDNKDLFNIRVVNMSINSTVEQSYHTSPLDAAVEVLWFNGIVVVASAGNKGSGDSYNTVNAAPANDPFIITVGASDEHETIDRGDDTIAPYSAFGTTLDGHVKPEIIAPGTDIISVLATSSDWYGDYPERAVLGMEYFRISGTSSASPMVAGTVALLLQAEPDLTPDQVKHRLIHSGSDLEGYAYLDVRAALSSTTRESSNTGIQASQLLWTGDDPITWGSVNWNSVNWNSVNWNSVNWNSVNWNSVNWNSVNWDD
jgi:serine protease AprX